MKDKLLQIFFFVTCLCVSFETNAQNDTTGIKKTSIQDTTKPIDSAAYKYYKLQLQQIENWIYYLGPSNIYFAISELENITGIISNSSGDYLGKYDPSDKDYSDWKQWLEDNKYNLCWDEEKKKMNLCGGG